MKKLLAISLTLFAVYSFADEEPIMQSGKPEVSKRTQRIANKYEKDLRSGRIKERTNHALDSIVRLSVYKLRRTGHKAEAAQFLKEWEEQYQYILIGRGIGDHKPLSTWLAAKYDMLELILGKEICHALRLSDIKTINYAVPVVFACEDHVTEAEFFLHFVADDTNGYRGLGPVVAYWTTFIVCVGGTWGTGFLFCSPIAMGVEYLSDSFICPRLNEPIWKLSCGG